MNRKRISSLIVGLVAFTSVTALSTSGAFAVDSYTLSCSGGSVKATKGSAGLGYIRITVRNGCSNQRRVKVYVANNTDTACLSYNSGQSRSFVYSWPSDLDRIAFC
jgi:hypothetical protein